MKYIFNYTGVFESFNSIKIPILFKQYLEIFFQIILVIKKRLYNLIN